MVNIVVILNLIVDLGMKAMATYPFADANTITDVDAGEDEDADEAIPIDRKSKYMLRIGAMV